MKKKSPVRTYLKFPFGDSFRNVVKDKATANAIRDEVTE